MGRFGYPLLSLAVAGVVAGSAAAFAHMRVRPPPIARLVSGSPQLKTAADGADVRWHKPAVTVYFDRSLAELAPNAADAAQAGFGTWIGSDARLPSVSFDTTQGAAFGTVPNGKSEVSYGPIKIRGHERDLALTIAFSDQSSGEIVEADTIFNSEHAFGLLASEDVSNGQESEADDCKNKYDLQAIATHEAGHFFGLGEDFDVRSATMYYSTARCELHKRVLTASDVTTMSGLYANGEDPVPAASNGCSFAAFGGSGTRGRDASYAALTLLALAHGRRRRR